jgi:phosphatidate cytidylyltransferase
LLRYRLLSAFIIISLSLCFVGLDAWYPVGNCHGAWMIPLGAYLIFGSALECTALLRGTRFGPVDRPALIGCAGIMIASIVPMLWPLSGQSYPKDCILGELGWPMTAAVFALVGAFAWHLPNYQTGNHDFERAIIAGWIAAYFGICFAFWIATRLIGDSAWGLYLMVGVIVVTKFSDAGAYFAGRMLGRRKLCPAVSPGKTVEGFFGGMIVAILAAGVYFGIFASIGFGADRVRADWKGIVALGVLLTISGLFGDLLESIFKREAQAKDSGKLMPGLGGLWDVTDSLLPAPAVAYIIFVAEWIKGPGQG